MYTLTYRLITTRAQIAKLKEQQKMQYLNKKKNMYGERQGNMGQYDDRFSLDKMNLDRKDQGVEIDPFLNK